MTDEYSLLWRCIGRDKWLAAKRIPDGAEHIHCIFAGGGDIPPDPRKVFCAGQRSETTRHSPDARSVSKQYINSLAGI
jgi:hypothetical protein